MIRISKHLETAIITITIAVIVILSNIIWAPDFSVNAATMQNPEGIYLNQAFVDAGAGSRTETLEEWQAFLTSNADSDYYLGTPYSAWLYAASPRGDKWQYSEGFARSINNNGGTTASGGMNCTGFVWHILSNSLAATNETTMKAVSGCVPNVRYFNSKGFLRKAWTGGNNRWYDFIVKFHLHYYEFKSKAEMLSSGVLRKGDIIWCVDGSVGKGLKGLSTPANYHHIGIYMGSGNDDLWWQSGPTIADGNLSAQKNSINPIFGCAKSNTYVVIPFGEDMESDPIETATTASTDIIDSPLSISGDFNGDETLTVADAVMLIRLISEDSKLSDEQIDKIIQAEPDQDADGIVTMSDLTTFLETINEWLLRESSSVSIGSVSSLSFPSCA